MPSFALQDVYAFSETALRKGGPFGAVEIGRSVLYRVRLMPTASDALTNYYAVLLDGSYDCVDRIVLNGNFGLCYSPGGFRSWWRVLHNGSDAELDNAHLMRMASRFSRTASPTNSSACWARHAIYRASGFTICGTRTRRICSRAEFTPRWRRSVSDIQRLNHPRSL